MAGGVDDAVLVVEVGWWERCDSEIKVLMSESD